MCRLGKSPRVKYEGRSYKRSIFLKKKKRFSLRDRALGLDIAEQSLRDVFNDVSKYTRNISVSLNRLFP